MVADIGEEIRPPRPQTESRKEGRKREPKRRRRRTKNKNFFPSFSPSSSSSLFFCNPFFTFLQILGFFLASNEICAPLSLVYLRKGKEKNLEKKKKNCCLAKKKKRKDDPQLPPPPALSPGSLALQLVYWRIQNKQQFNLILHGGRANEMGAEIQSDGTAYFLTVMYYNVQTHGYKKEKNSLQTFATSKVLSACLKLKCKEDLHCSFPWRALVHVYLNL